MSVVQLNILVEGLVNQPAVKMSPSNEQLGIKLRQIVARVEEAQVCYIPLPPELVKTEATSSD
jgi:hypothetical protein